MSDILLSVWNRFFSDEQVSGFSRAGFRVHWLGNRRPPKSVSQTSVSVLSWSLLRLHFLTGYELPKHLSMESFDIASGMLRWRSKLVWAYVEQNNRLISNAKRRGVPVILDVPIGHQRQFQDILTREYQGAGLKPPAQLWERWSTKCENAYEQADFISVGSTFVKTTLVNRGINPTKIIVNPYGIDAKLWQDTYVNKCSQPQSGKTVFIYTASIGVRKGIHYLLRAWKKANLKDAELWIAGGGRLDLDAISGGLPSSICVLGYLNHQELALRYSQAHVYVLPSLFEGLARSGLEAMAAGLPVIITNETGLTDFVTHGVQGWIVPSANVDALVDRIRHCHTNRDVVSRAGHCAFSTMRAQSFDAYGDKCAAIAACIINGNDPNV